MAILFLAPYGHSGAARALVDYAEISPEQKAGIAGGNLARLLGLETMPGPYPPARDGLILEQAKQGRPVDHIPVIDPHTHGAYGVRTKSAR